MCTEPTTLICRRRKDNYQSERSVSNKKPKDQSTHTNRIGFVASAATITVVVRLASVTTEGCSVACVVIFVAVVVRDMKSGLAKWKEAGRNGKGGDGMHLCLCGTYSARHTKAAVYRDAARMAAEVLLSVRTGARLLHI